MSKGTTEGGGTAEYDEPNDFDGGECKVISVCIEHKERKPCKQCKKKKNKATPK